MVMVSSVLSSSLYMCLFTLGRKQWLVRSKFKFACWVMLLAPHPPEPDTPPLAHPREAVVWGNVTNHAIIPFSALWCLKSLFQLKFLWINICTTKSCSSSWVHAFPTWNTGHPSHSPYWTLHFLSTSSKFGLVISEAFFYWDKKGAKGRKFICPALPWITSQAGCPSPLHMGTIWV